MPVATYGDVESGGGDQPLIKYSDLSPGIYEVYKHGNRVDDLYLIVTEQWRICYDHDTQELVPLPGKITSRFQLVPKGTEIKLQFIQE